MKNIYFSIILVFNVKPVSLHRLVELNRIFSHNNAYKMVKMTEQTHAKIERASVIIFVVAFKC